MSERHALAECNAADVVAFGMGEHNHKCLRSETEHAYKTCLVGTPRLAAGLDSAHDGSPRNSDEPPFKPP